MITSFILIGSFLRSSSPSKWSSNPCWWCQEELLVSGVVRTTRFMKTW
jgi:hypothetical protein